MGHAFAADPTREAAALIRLGSPALIVFRDRTELAWCSPSAPIGQFE
jgi:hypothetical protein